MGGPPILMLAPGACLALTVWTQVAVGFILPTAVLLMLQRRQQARSSAVARAAAARQQQGAPPASELEAAAPLLLPDWEDEWGIPSVSFFAAQMLWLLLRVTLHDASA